MTQSTSSNPAVIKKEASQFGQQIRNNLQTYALVLAMIAIWILFFFQTDGIYLSSQNFSNLFRQMTITAIMSVGMVLVIVAGHIDLSVGKLSVYVSVIVAYFQAYYWADHLPNAPALLTTALSVLVGLGVGTLYGVVQGWIIAYLRVPSFITTLGSMWILNGLILIATVGKTIPANQPLFSIIAQDYIPKTTGWIIGGIVAVVLFITMFMGRRRKRKYGITVSPLWQDLLKTILMAGIVLGYVYYVNVYRGIQNPVMILIVIAVVFS
jgi:D-xylose transport system permease protein